MIKLQRIQSTLHKASMGVYRQRVTIIAICLLYSAAIIGHYVIHNREYQLKHISNTLKTTNPILLTRIIESEDRNTPVTKETLQPFIEYLKTNPKYPQKLYQQLLTKNHTKDAQFKLAIEGTHLFILNRYVLIAQPRMLTAVTGAEGGTIYINNRMSRTTDVADTVSLGKVLPGIYQLTVIATAKGNQLKQTQELNTFSKGQSNFSEFNASFHPITSDLLLPVGE